MLTRSRLTLVMAGLLSLNGLLNAETVPPVTRRPVPAARLTENALLKNVTRYENLVYAKVGERELVLDLYIPKKAEKPMPLVVWIHGGGWRSGSKRPCRSLFLTEHGFAAAGIGYRLSGEATFPAQVHDCKAAIRCLRANASTYGIDPNAIGVWGSSAGGHLAAMMGSSAGVKEADGAIGEHTDVSTAVQAVCSWFGPTDFFTMPIGRRQFAQGEDPEILVLGGRISEKQDLAALVSPATHVTKDDPPFLFMHGDQDRLVPLQQSQLMHDKLRTAGVSSELIIMKGQGHGFRNDPELLKPVLDFFNKHLRHIEPTVQKADDRGN